MMQWIMIAELVIRLLELQQSKKAGGKITNAEVSDVLTTSGLSQDVVNGILDVLPNIGKLAGRIEKLIDNSVF